MSVTVLVTAEELLRMPEDPPYELVAGELRSMSPTNPQHSDIMGALVEFLRPYARQRKLGRVLPGDCTFLIASDPDTVLCPDVAFISARRVAAQPLGKKCWRGSPDLAIEILSPSNTLAEIHEKVLAYLAAGSRLVWVVDADAHTVTVHRSATNVATLGEDAELDAEPLIPGFRCHVADLFAE